MLQKKYELKSICSLTDNFNVSYKHDFIDKYKANKYYDLLEQNLIYNTAEESKVVVFGKEYLIARKQVSYGEAGTFYSFAGTTVYSKDWNTNDIVCRIIKNIKHKVEVFTGKKFNFVLINRYANGNDKIMAHRDNENGLDKEAPIAGVSLGAVRDVCFVPYKFIPNKLAKRITIELEHGSIFVMNTPTNTYWTHEIPQRSNVHSPRISLTFRNLII